MGNDLETSDYIRYIFPEIIAYISCFYFVILYKWKKKYFLNDRSVISNTFLAIYYFLSTHF